VATWLSSPEKRRFVRLKAANMKATRAYRASIFDGAITLIRSSKRASLSRWDRHLQWAELAAQGLDCHVVPGKHSNTFREPNVRELARQVNDCLRKAQNRDNPL
jgi:thioesterase domain-containing protein